MYFNDNIKELSTRFFLLGKNESPTIQLSVKYFKGITIGLKTNKNEIQSDLKDKEVEPDYWINDKQQSELLLHLFKFYKEESNTRKTTSDKSNLVA